jgi:hypothetical protein
MDALRLVNMRSTEETFWGRASVARFIVENIGAQVIVLLDRLGSGSKSNSVVESQKPNPKTVLKQLDDLPSFSQRIQKHSSACGSRQRED